MKQLILILGLFSQTLLAQHTFLINRIDSYEKKTRTGEYEYLNTKYQNALIEIPESASYIDVTNERTTTRYYVVGRFGEEEAPFFQIVSNSGDKFDFAVKKGYFAFFWEDETSAKMLVMYVKEKR